MRAPNPDFLYQHHSWLMMPPAYFGGCKGHSLVLGSHPLDHKDDIEELCTGDVPDPLSQLTASVL